MNIHILMICASSVGLILPSHSTPIHPPPRPPPTLLPAAYPGNVGNATVPLLCVRSKMGGERGEDGGAV